MSHLKHLMCFLCFTVYEITVYEICTLCFYLVSKPFSSWGQTIINFLVSIYDGCSDYVGNMFLTIFYDIRTIKYCQLKEYWQC